MDRQWEQLNKIAILEANLYIHVYDQQRLTLFWKDKPQTGRLSMTYIKATMF